MKTLYKDQQYIGRSHLEEPSDSETYIGYWDSYNRSVGHTLWVEKYPDYYEYIYDWQAVPGMVRWGLSLGFKDPHALIFKPCPDCGRPRWVRIDRQGRLCKSCARKAWWSRRQ